MKYTQRDLRNVEKKVSYNLTLAEELYEEVREFASQNRLSIAFTFQSAIEEYLEKHSEKGKGK